MRNKLLPYNPALKELAKKLRKESTLGEVLLWKQIKNRTLGFQFHRQVPIDNYIVDFYCHELMLAVEVDGSSHNDELVFANDILRQQRLEHLGVTFFRVSDRDVKSDMRNVILGLVDFIEQLNTH